MFQRIQRTIVALALVLVLVTTSACGAVSQSDRTSHNPGARPTIGFQQPLRGDNRASQDFGNWVVQTSKGLIQDAYVRGNDKLGVVISSQVRPNEVRSLAKSLVQGFRQNASDRDLTVLVYAPDKKLIMTAKYDNTTKQVRYE